MPCRLCFPGDLRSIRNDSCPTVSQYATFPIYRLVDNG